MSECYKFGLNINTDIIVIVNGWFETVIPTNFVNGP